MVLGDDGFQAPYERTVINDDYDPFGRFRGDGSQRRYFGGIDYMLNEREDRDNARKAQKMVADLVKQFTIISADECAELEAHFAL